MNAKNFRDFVDRKPFARFVVHLADGRVIPVEHPDYIFCPPNGQELIVYQPDDSFDFIDIFNHLAQIPETER